MTYRTPRTRPNPQVLEEASIWFVDFRSGDIDAQAREEFHAWLRRSPDHIQAYMDIASTYAEIPAPGADGQLDVAALIAHARVSSDDNVVSLTATEVASTGSRAEATALQGRVGRSRRPRSLAAAAAVLFAIVSLSAWYHFQRGVYGTQIGEQRSLTLEDGSTVELNSNSRIRVRYTKLERHIDLIQGQALFEVARDKAHPFIVQTDQIRVRAVGTQFDVYRKQGGTVVTVVEGRVAIEPERASSGGSVALGLAAGEQLIVKPESIERPAHANVTAATAWTARQLIFDGTPLREVAEEFNRYTARRLIVESGGLEDFHISGTYSSTNPESLLRFLRAQPGLRITETDREIRVAAQ